MSLTKEAVCDACTHPASWHLRSSSFASDKVKRNRCMVKVRNERGFPAACGCRAYRRGRAA